MSGSSGQKKSHKGYSRVARQWSLGGSDHKKKEEIISEAASNFMGVVKSKSRRSVSSSSKEMKAHPVLKAMEAPKIDKALMTPEFLRYLDYIKEAGTWDPNSSSPVIYFK